MTPLPTEIVGRQAELERIEGVLAAPDRLPTALLVEGEAGIGKTIVWQCAVGLAERNGFVVLSCALAESEARLAFAGLSDLARPVLDELLPTLPSTQGRALAEALLLAEGGSRVPDERAVAFGFLGLLTALGARAPVAVAVDDLQWLDASSLVTLRYVARRLHSEPIVLILARRAEQGGDPDPLRLGETGLPTERIAIEGVAIGALHRLLRLRLGRPLSRPRLRAIHETSRGNPMHAIELARSIDPVTVGPGSLAGLLQARVAALPPPSRAALTVAAATSDASLELLERVRGPDLPGDLAAAVAADLVWIDRGRVRFVHPLVSTAVGIVAGDVAVREAHSALARIVTSPEERARHLGHATADRDSAVALALEQAADDVRRRGARAVSAELYEAAANLTPLVDAPARGRRVVACADAIFQAGDSEHAEALLVPLVDELPEGEVRAQARWRLGTILDETGRWRKAVAVWTEALRSTCDPRLRAELLRSLAITTAYTGSAAAARRYADDAVEEAERSSDPKHLSYALAAQAFVSMLSGGGDHGPIVERALRLEASVDELLGEWSPTAVAAECARLTGDVEGSRLHYERMLERAVMLGDAGVEQWAAFGLASTELLTGAYERSSELADTVFDISEQTGVMRIPAQVLRAHVDAHLGRIDTARDLVSAATAYADAERETIHLYNARIVAGFVEMSAGEPAAAAALYEGARTIAEAIGLSHATVLRSFLHEAEAAAACGRVDQAEAALGSFEQASAGRGGLGMTAARARAAVRAARGELAEATAELHRGLDSGDWDPPLERGRTLLLLGAVLRRSHEHTAARDALREAVTAFERLGAAAWVERAREELARIPGRRAGSADELTQAERRIAELVAAGRSNKEVAARLFLSVKTVEVTLTRVYRKLGVRNRAELAARFGELAKQ